MSRKWSKEAIGDEILSLYQSGTSLNYSYICRTYCALLRAAVRYFGTWEAAVNFAGLDYNDFRIYQSWTRERIIERIQELHAQGADLSWSNVSTNLDRQLASAAIKKSYFGSWGNALECAGLDYETIRRYREWDEERIMKYVKQFHESGQELNAKSISEVDIGLITAARRQYEVWHEALTAAGLDYQEIVKRAPFRRGQGRGQSKKSNV